MQFKRERRAAENRCVRWAQSRLLQNMDNSWSLRFGPLTAMEVGKAVSAFVQ